LYFACSFPSSYSSLVVMTWRTTYDCPKSLASQSRLTPSVKRVQSGSLPSPPKRSTSWLTVMLNSRIQVRTRPLASVAIQYEPTGYDSQWITSSSSSNTPKHPVPNTPVSV
jgi:hypothetical protein